MIDPLDQARHVLDAEAATAGWDTAPNPAFGYAMLALISALWLTGEDRLGV